MKRCTLFFLLGSGILGILFIASDVFGVDYTAKGKAVMQGTSDNSTFSGMVNFSETENGLIVEAELSNVPPGKHGFHIHQFGSCDDGGKAAGGHYNPGGTQHGLLTGDGHENAHAGDMGNISIDQDGTGSLSLVLPQVGLVNGLFNIAGRAVILHAKEDDFGQPTGNAGARIACGTIVIVQE